jgi:hypothetical protein
MTATRKKVHRPPYLLDLHMGRLDSRILLIPRRRNVVKDQPKFMRIARLQRLG